MAYGHSGRYINVEIENTYEYAGQDFMDWSQFVDYLSYNLNMSQHIDSYKTDVRSIADEIVELAREFIEENGTYQSGELSRSVRWIPTDKGFQLLADAVDEHGRHYAGHIEYGFTDKAGLPHGPWPFLRPAMRVAAEMSTGVLADRTASDILYGYGQSTSLKFGRADLDAVASAAGGRSAVRQQVRESYGARHQVHRWQGHAKQDMGLQNKYRWRDAGHGVNYKGKIAPYAQESFDRNYGPHQDRWDFRGGVL